MGDDIEGTFLHVKRSFLQILSQNESYIPEVISKSLNTFTLKYGNIDFNLTNESKNFRKNLRALIFKV